MTSNKEQLILHEIGRNKETLEIPFFPPNSLVCVVIIRWEIRIGGGFFFFLFSGTIHAFRCELIVLRFIVFEGFERRKGLRSGLALLT